MTEFEDNVRGAVGKTDVEDDNVPEPEVPETSGSLPVVASARIEFTEDIEESGKVNEEVQV